MGTEDYRERFTPLALSRLRTSSRLVAVVTYTSYVDLPEIGGSIRHGLIGREVINPNLKDGRNWRMLTRHEQPDSTNPPGWSSIFEFVPRPPTTQIKT